MKQPCLLQFALPKSFYSPAEGEYLEVVWVYMEQVFPISFPYVPGTDFSGIVEETGTKVSDLNIGDRVFGRTAPNLGGALSEKLVIPGEDLCKMAESMSFEQAAALPTAFGTAHFSLFEIGKLECGQRVLIQAAAGGVGSIAVQLAHHAGAYVVATSSNNKVPLVKSLGADEVVDYREDDFTQFQNIDLVLDSIGGETLERSWSVLAPEGRITSLVDFNIKSRGHKAGEFVFFSSATPFLSEATRQFNLGLLQVIIDSIFPENEIHSAYAKLQTGHACGKVIVRMSN